MKKLTWFSAALSVAAVLAFSLLSAEPTLAQPYEGFGRAVTGGDAFPTCLVSNLLSSGPNSFSDCARRGNVKVIFASPGPYAVDKADVTYLNSNTTIDGCANGQAGVTLDQPSDTHRAITFEAGGSSSGTGNIKIQCIRFQGHGKSAGATTEHDLLSFDATNGAIVGVLVDRCTFFGATDGALDITGNVSAVTVSHSLFYSNPLTSLIKYGGSNDGNSGIPGHDITLHHNVFTRNGERNPQIRGGVSVDLVSNVVGPGARLTDFEGGGQFDMYGTRLYSSTDPSEGPPGNVKANLTNSAFLGTFDSGPNTCSAAGVTGINICTDPGASNSGIFLSANLCTSGACAPSPSATPWAVPSSAIVLITPVNSLKASLPGVGSPTRLGQDQAMLDGVAALLPGSGPVPTPTPGPTPVPTPTPLPTPTPVPTPVPTPGPTPTPCPVPPPATATTTCSTVVATPDASTLRSTVTCVTIVKH